MRRQCKLCLQSQTKEIDLGSIDVMCQTTSYLEALLATKPSKHDWIEAYEKTRKDNSILENFFFLSLAGSTDQTNFEEGKQLIFGPLSSTFKPSVK